LQVKFIHPIFALEILSMASKLEIWSSELLDKVQAYLNSEESKNGASLLRLIQNSNIEFEVNQSSRMLNYYEEKGFIKAYRIGNGKRRFSMSDVLAFGFSLYLNQIGLPDAEIKKYNDLIHKKQKNGHTEFDLAIFYAVVILGLEDLWLFRSEDNQQHLLTIRNREEKAYFALSEEIRKLLSDPENKVFENARLFKFIPEFLNEIDKIRNQIGIPLLNEHLFNLSQEVGIEKVVKDFDLENANVLQQLPFNALKKKFKFYLKNEEDELFGINIELVGKREYIPSAFEGKVFKSLEELNEKIRILIQEKD
jgi:DNA-binding transcriptional MerR regulator